jgi:hypothetical protein
VPTASPLTATAICEEQREGLRRLADTFGRRPGEMVVAPTPRSTTDPILTKIVQQELGFPDQAMTLAAIDRLVHHVTILEMNVERYRRKATLDRKRGRGRPPAHATPKESRRMLIDVQPFPLIVAQRQPDPGQAGAERQSSNHPAASSHPD